MHRLLNPVYKTLRCDLKMQKQWILGLSLINRHKSRTVLWDHRLIQIFEKVPSALWTKTTGDQSSPRGTASPCTTWNWECAPHCVIIIILWHQTNWQVKILSWLFWGSFVGGSLGVDGKTLGVENHRLEHINSCHLIMSGCLDNWA